MTFTPPVLNIPPGWTLPVIVSFKPPTGLTVSNFPVYSGYIKATGSDNSTLQSTYIGVAAKLKDMKILDNTDAYFNIKLPLMTDANGEPVPPGGSATYTLNNNNSNPLILYRLVAGTPLLRVDLIDSKTNVMTNTRRSLEVEERAAETSDPDSALSKRSGLAWLFSGKGSSGTFGAVRTFGILYQEDYISRNSLAGTVDDNGYSALQVTAFANGTAIPDGSYKILVRALRITGNPTREEDFEVWTSPEVIVKRT